MAWAVDFESYYDDEVSIKTMGSWHYLRHPKMDIYLASIYGPGGEWVGRPEDFEWGDIAGDEWVSHNASFDPLVYERLKELHPKLPWPDPPRWNCSSDLSAYFGSGRALAQAGPSLLGVKVDKTYRITAKGKHFRELDAAGQKKVLDAGIQDARTCWQLWDKYSPRWPEQERRLSELTRQMGWRGVCVDTAKLEIARDVFKRVMWEAEGQIPWAGAKDGKGELVPTLSAKALAAHCRTVGIEPPVSLAKTDPLLDEWLETHGKNHPWVRAMSQYRRYNTKFQKIETMLSRTMPNGRMSYGLKYGGAHTLRWSGDAGWNAQNMDKAAVYIDQEGNLIEDPKRLKKIEAYQKKHNGENPSFVRLCFDLRSCVIAAPGKKFIICDLSQIEPRVLAWIIGDMVFLAACAAGNSPYEAHARATMGWTGGVLQDEDLMMYLLAKARLLALGYGAGWHKFMGMCKTYGVPDEVFDAPLAEGEQERFEKYLQGLPEDEPEDDGQPAKKVVRTSQWLLYSAGTELQKKRYTNAWLIVCDFRESNPLLTRVPDKETGVGKPGLWYSMFKAFKMARGGTYDYELPSGRVMSYKNVSGIKGNWTAEVVKDGVKSRVHFYGGKLVENLVQATARDVFAEAKLRISDAGYTVVLTIHDEVVVEVDEDVEISTIEHLMSLTPSWLRGCPVAAKGKEARYYKK